MIRWFKTMTTNDFIKSVNAGLFRPFNKKIWQKSYYEHVIRNDNDYALTLEYICNNPLKLELIRGNAAVEIKITAACIRRKSNNNNQFLRERNDFTK